MRRPRRSNAKGPRKTCFAGNSRRIGENGSGKEINRLPPDRGLPPSFVLPPSDEGGGKPKGFDGGRDATGLRKAGYPEQTGCEFSPSVAYGDSSLVRGSQGVVGGRSLSRLRSPVQKEEGLREEHGFSRQIARGPRRGAARRFRRNARDQEGVRGAFRPWYKGPPAAFLSTFRRWKVDFALRACRRGRFPGGGAFPRALFFLSFRRKPQNSTFFR